MLWTAPPPAHERHGCGCCLRPHDSVEPSHASDYDNDFALHKLLAEIPGLMLAREVTKPMPKLGRAVTGLSPRAIRSTSTNAAAPIYFGRRLQRPSSARPTPPVAYRA